MAHHVTDENPTRYMWNECAATRQIDGETRWFHMCGLPYEHASVHCCGECNAKWGDI